MSRNATASWSGYAHQGKIGLLVALKKINALHGTQNRLEDFELSYETQEDVKISTLGNAIEIHQVKAYRGGIHKSAYTDALVAFERCPGNNNYLHSICEIINWDTLTAAQNPHNVIRFLYAPTVNFCSLEDIHQYIDTEIVIMLRNRNHPQSENLGWRTNGFQEFLAILDDKIRSEHHLNNAATYNISFNLLVIATILSTQPTKFSSKINAIRQDLFKVYETFIEELDENQKVLTPEHEILVKDTIARIYSLDNEQFKKFLGNINPHTSFGKDLSTSETTDSFFSSETFSSTFLEALISVTRTQYKLDDKFIPSYFKDLSYILTSIQAVDGRMGIHAKNILQNESVDYTAYENDFIITHSYDGPLIDLANKLITKSSRSAEKFTSKKKMHFISVVNAIGILNG